MKVIICCPHCGNEDLKLKKITNPYVYICNKCNTEFDSMWSGFNTHKHGSISDGYHTFDELYYHRMILFSIICNTNPQKAWKSWKHEDGSMCDDYFIVGIRTIEGDYTYHYQKDQWDMFDVREIDNAPRWDGHQPSDITRLLSLI